MYKIALFTLGYETQKFDSSIFHNKSRKLGGYSEIVLKYENDIGRLESIRTMEIKKNQNVGMIIWQTLY